MQEHIRRAHPEHYIPKLPATEESFLLMINSPPSDHRADQASTSTSQSLSLPSAWITGDRPRFANSRFRTGTVAHDRRTYYRDGSSNPGTPRHSDEYTTSGGGSLLGAANAAVALAELHGVKSERDVDVDGYYSDSDGRRIPRTSIELPPLHLSNNDVTSDPYTSNVNRQREILPSLLAHSPPGRSSTLPPLQRPLGPSRPRKPSITKRGRESNHKKKSSRGSAADWFRRFQNEDRFRPANDRKALSAEPSADFGKRWEDLIDAADQAASAAGDLDEDRTPVPQSPVSIHRASVPPLSHAQFQSGNYQASPLQQALTPPSYNQDSVDPFPSVESGESGENFHIGSRGLSDSSPTYSSQNTQIYCAACQKLSLLKSSYACTECICGLCSTCVEVLMAELGARRKCPRCATIGGRFKPFQLDIR
ncbi:RfeD protein [Metarhizium album ARSEF 1941]|uniref:RfeD protein n=1 Tax=Metarhizium album (strain ARSEF 1941) TaxID=1081103 RepID=A0A0B2X178_METAS|nr:RfeD protein [Metarhizium album ARSEF 1941]KHO00089.1 RfeD protein [Metarhizium album ARSEF 1941]